MPWLKKVRDMPDIDGVSKNTIRVTEGILRFLMRREKATRAKIDEFLAEWQIKYSRPGIKKILDRMVSQGQINVHRIRKNEYEYSYAYLPDVEKYFTPKGFFHLLFEQIFDATPSNSRNKGDSGEERMMEDLVRKIGLYHFCMEMYGLREAIKEKNYLDFTEKLSKWRIAATPPSFEEHLCRRLIGSRNNAQNKDLPISDLFARKKTMIIKKISKLIKAMEQKYPEISASIEKFNDGQAEYAIALEQARHVANKDYDKEDLRRKEIKKRLGEKLQKSSS